MGELPGWGVPAGGSGAKPDRGRRAGAVQVRLFPQQDGAGEADLLLHCSGVVKCRSILNDLWPAIIIIVVIIIV